MKISVLHSTVYRYDGPVQLSPHTIRMRPRDDASQRLISHELRVEPTPAGRTCSLDQDGNVVTNVWFDKPLRSMAVHSRFEVETLRVNPFDFVITEPALLTLPARYPEPLRGTLAGYATAAEAHGDVHEFACSVAQQAQWRTMPFLTTLVHGMHRLFRHVTRPEGPAQPSAVTLDSQQGSCRDLAVLFADACRSLGLAARFVSGYDREAASSDPAYMHAWVEVYLPGGGWRGYDPSRGLAVSDSHVAVAAALTPELAAPISGGYAGNAVSSMETSIQMEVNTVAPQPAPALAVTHPQR